MSYTVVMMYQSYSSVVIVCQDPSLEFNVRIIKHDCLTSVFISNQSLRYGITDIP